MKKRIQVETVQRTANVEVIFMNTSFVAKVMNADYALKDAQLRTMQGDIDNTLQALNEVQEFFDEMLIAFGVMEEPKPETKDEEIG